ncbi:methyltransferase domain-containing protein [Catellatospora sp. KI3]|uniref:class I SAM-dependent methyltransferase n=1 Tax=Catellatospora sp. KI3 TaxID=3041620 RepID=UPI002483204E|nr:methyltransferase domain-containing protein [Catellatospora sp. KI3]MDI1462708.1 methyltransferase domain-containing protein [Catellatospora sp. KI3]
MARIAYDGRDAAAFEASRHLSDHGLAAWRAAVDRHLSPGPCTRLLDLGAGTGMWAGAFTTWYPGMEVIAVDPSAAMRARCSHPNVLAGDAADIPLADAHVDAVWVSTVIHHVPDLAAAAREVRRVLRPGGRVLIRSAFAGRHEAISLFRYFPEAVRVLDTFPSVADVEAAFATVGMATVSFEPVPQVTSPSLRELAAGLRREAHTPLQLITDDDYAAGLARLHRAVEVAEAPVIDALDLLVLR